MNVWACVEWEGHQAVDCDLTPGEKWCLRSGGWGAHANDWEEAPKRKKEKLAERNAVWVSDEDIL